MPRDQKSGRVVTLLARAIDPDNQPHVMQEGRGEKVFGAGDSLCYLLLLP